MEGDARPGDADSAPDPYDAVHAAVDLNMKQWWQGDVAPALPLIWLTSAASPITSTSRELVDAMSPVPDPNELIVVETEGRDVAVVSQTCDVQGRSLDDPFVQVAPVVDLTDTPIQLAEAQGGHSTRFAPLPGIGPMAFADLTKCTTVEKSVLSALTGKRVQGCATDDDRTNFARATSRHRGRHAFPDDVSRSLNKLRERLREKRAKQSPEGERIREVAEIRVNAPAGWTADALALELRFIVHATSLPPLGDDPLGASATTTEWLNSPRTIAEVAARIGDPTASLPEDRSKLWQALAALWAEQCVRVGQVTSITATAESADEYSIGQSWHEPKLDLDHLTS